MKALLIGLAVVIGLGAIGSVTNLITIPWLKFDSKVNMERGIVTKTYNAENAIYNYHWFQQTSEDIKSTDRKITDAQAALTDFEASAGVRTAWTFEDKTEDSRLRSVVQGLKSAYNDLTADYNARAKSVDRAIFQDSLPLFFNLK